jgi:hypothetical protein
MGSTSAHTLDLRFECTIAASLPILYSIFTKQKKGQCWGSGMVKEIVKKEDKDEVTSSRMDEGICSMFDLNKTYLFPDL